MDRELFVVEKQLLPTIFFANGTLNVDRVYRLRNIDTGKSIEQGFLWSEKLKIGSIIKNPVGSIDLL